MFLTSFGHTTFNSILCRYTNSPGFNKLLIQNKLKQKSILRLNR